MRANPRSILSDTDIATPSIIIEEAQYDDPPTFILINLRLPSFYHR